MMVKLFTFTEVKKHFFSRWPGVAGKKWGVRENRHNDWRLLTRIENKREISIINNLDLRVQATQPILFKF